MNYSDLPKQPPLYISYLRVGSLLYASLILFLLESWFYGLFLYKAFQQDKTWWILLMWLGCFVFSFFHIYLVLMDGWSRFQNYKRAKDLFFINGFHPRIICMYMGSKCQRMAVMVAAEELGIDKHLKDFYKMHGIKWYHFVPYFMVKDPFFLLKKKFWSRTFLEKNYVAKINFYQLPSKRVYV